MCYKIFTLNLILLNLSLIPNLLLKIFYFRWRTKQNLDYCFLMMYAQEKGIYYIQVSVACPLMFFHTFKGKVISRVYVH